MGAPALPAGRVASCALLGLAALLLVAACCSAWSGASRLAAREGDGASASAAAAAFVRAHGSFDHRRAELYAPRLAALATGELQRALASARVDPAAVSGRLVGAALVESAELTSLRGDTAVVAVRVRQERTRVDPGSGAELREDITRHASLRLVRSGGRWLVAEMELIGDHAGAGGAR